MADELFKRRAVKPSKKSNTAAITTNQKAKAISPATKIEIVAIAPHNKLPSVSMFGMVKSLIFIFFVIKMVFEGQSYE